MRELGSCTDKLAKLAIWSHCTNRPDHRNLVSRGVPVDPFDFEKMDRQTYHNETGYNKPDAGLKALCNRFSQKFLPSVGCIVYIAKMMSFTTSSPFSAENNLNLHRSVYN